MRHVEVGDVLSYETLNNQFAVRFLVLDIDKHGRGFGIYDQDTIMLMNMNQQYTVTCKRGTLENSIGSFYWGYRYV